MLRVGSVVEVVVAGKLATHAMGWEWLSMNPLLRDRSGQRLLMGFLLSGALSDFKESERLPGELSACLENLAQEVVAIRHAKPEAQVGPCLIQLSQLSQDILGWFHKERRSGELRDSLNALTPHFAAMDNGPKPPWLRV